MEWIDATADPDPAVEEWCREVVTRAVGARGGESARHQTQIRYQCFHLVVVSYDRE
jgi:hypothetical protein